jgi:hypothetical protein
MPIRDFVRSLKPGNDQQLAADLSTQRRAGHRRSLRATAREGQAWEDQDRQQDRKGPWYRPKQS